MQTLALYPIVAYAALLLLSLYGLYRWAVSDLAKWQRIIDADTSRTEAGRNNRFGNTFLNEAFKD